MDEAKANVSPLLSTRKVFLVLFYSQGHLDIQVLPRVDFLISARAGAGTQTALQAYFFQYAKQGSNPI